MAPPQSIDAPYNFVPLADWVHTPEWAEQVSHDIPFADGLSGHLDIRITAHTPIVVGGEQRKATAQAPGEVYPCKIGNTYGLPGTALKGMIRAVIEIATFSRFGMIDDVRYGLRDISGRYVKDAYTARVRNRVKTGFMRVGENGLPEITPCEMVRLPHDALKKWLELTSPVFEPTPDRVVSSKYQTWREKCQKKAKNADLLSFSPLDDEAVDLGAGTHQGVPVLTGQISKSTEGTGKKNDFIFYDEDLSRTFRLSRQDWSDFLFVHGDQATKDAKAMSWPGYWKERYWRDEPVPVFYIQDGGKTRVGLAYMPRLAGDFSVAEMVSRTCPEHLQGQGRGRWDFAETLFGTVGDNSNACLKGRVAFGHAIVSGPTRPEWTDPTILNGPKASYFPNYLRQQANRQNWTLSSRGYATYLKSDENPKPEVRGWKRYPVRPPDQSAVQQLTAEQLRNPKVQMKLQALHGVGGAKVNFTSRIVFHNLKPQEFGALCWALTWGGSTELRHCIGMGKHFGFGQVSIEISAPQIRAYASEALPKRWEEYRDDFIAYMNEVCAPKGRSWSDFEQIRTLLGMANPENPSRLKGQLKHMVLETRGRNEFLEAKQCGLVLEDYPHFLHPPTWGEQQAEEARQAIVKRLTEDLAEKKERIRAKHARLRTEMEMLPQERKEMVLLKKAWRTHRRLSEQQQQQNREALISKINRFADLAITWTDREMRQLAADLIERIFDQIGWADPGKKADKRKKQEDKRRGMVVNVREGVAA
jgi:CRISPR-associated protein (TIGR03986 family)